MSETTATKQEYYKRINRVLVYINTHLDENLELAKLAELSNFSPFHFHRIFRAHVKESIGSYISRIRIETAASLIMHTREPVSDIALRVGYDIPSSFNKAFQRRFGCPPTKFRNGYNINHSLKTVEMENTKKIKEVKPEIRVQNLLKVIFVRSVGDYNGEGTGDAWKKVCDFASRNNLFGRKTEFIGISHDDPQITKTAKLRYDACLTVNRDVRPEGEVGVKEIEGGKYAVFLHKGPYNTLHLAYDIIYGQWLPESKYELRNVPCFEKYLNDPEKVSPEKLKTEIFIPVL